MQNVCTTCGPEKSEECGIAKPCPLCKHTHDHAGCHECDCKVCPTCGHVHGAHEGHEESHA